MGLALGTQRVIVSFMKTEIIPALSDDLQVAVDIALEAIDAHHRVREIQQGGPNSMAHLVWDAVHCASRTKLDADRLRAILRLALHVAPAMASNQIVGIRNDRIALTGIAWWCGVSHESERWSPCVETVRDFASGNIDEATFRASILADLKASQ